MSQPKIKVNKSTSALLSDKLSLILLVGLWVYTAMKFNLLPDTIPTHFNFQGEADSYGSKYMIWLLPLLGLFSYITFKYISTIPHKFNYPTKITEENAPTKYRQALNMMSFINLATIIIFSYLTLNTILIASGGPSILSSMTLVGIITVPLLLPFFFLLKS